MNRKCIALLMFILPIMGWADLQKELNAFFDSFGGSANVSAAEVYQGQKAGYATGGGITVRNRVMNTKIAALNLPEFDAGCGGIDIYTGGFSFIDSEQLVNTLKSIGSSSIGYAFLLGLETVSPQIANTIRQLQSWANTINSMGINSCETAAQLVGSVWPKHEMASQHICRSMGGHEGLFKSYVAGRHQCGERDTLQKTKTLGTQKYPDLLLDDYNIAWRAIKKQNFFSNQKDLAELFMTIMGTLIIRGVDGKKEIDAYPSKISEESFLRVILEGGQGIIYKCVDGKQCLQVKEESLVISPEQSWTGKVKDILLTMQDKILRDEELSEQEKEFLAKSRLPLYTIVNILTAYKKGVCPIDFYQVADIVAMDMLVQCLKDGLEVVRNGCQQLRNVQQYSFQIDEYILDLDRVRKEIQYYEARSMQMMEREIQILQKMQMLEDKIAAELFLF